MVEHPASLDDEQPARNVGGAVEGVPTKSKPAKKLLIVEVVGGKVAVNLDLVETAALAPLSGPGLLDETVYLRLRMCSGNVVDVVDEKAQTKVLSALGVEAKDLAEQEVAG